MPKTRGEKGDYLQIKSNLSTKKRNKETKQRKERPNFTILSQDGKKPL